MVNLGYTVQAVNNLLAFILQLALIWQMLPTATATKPEMLTSGLLTKRRGLLQALDAPFGIGVFLARQPNRSNVARRPIGDEHYHIVNAGNRITLRRN